MGREKECHARVCERLTRLFRGAGNEKSPPRNQKEKVAHRPTFSFWLHGSASVTFVLRVMPTSVARWVSKRKTIKYRFSFTVSPKVRVRRGERTEPTAHDTRRRRARSDNPEVRGAARPYKASCACLRPEKSPPRNQQKKDIARCPFIVLDKHLERLYNNHKGFML
jgi:hypothetical protein